MTHIKSREGKSRRRNSTSLDLWQQRVSYAVRHLADRDILSDSPLARLRGIQRLAKEHYSNQVLPRGLALREVMTVCVEKIAKDLAGEAPLAKARTYLILTKDGMSCKQIGRELGLSREHISRVIRPKAFQLLAEEFLNVIRSNRRRSAKSHGLHRLE